MPVVLQIEGIQDRMIGLSGKVACAAKGVSKMETARRRARESLTMAAAAMALAAFALLAAAAMPLAQQALADGGESRFAVLTDGGDLRMYCREDAAPVVGSVYDGHKVAGVWEDFDAEKFEDYRSPWFGQREDIRKATVVDPFAPRSNSTDCWFYRTRLSSTSGLAKLDFSKVVSARRMFGESRLKGLGGLSGWDTSSLSDAEGMFGACHRLKDVSALSGWDVSGVVDMGDMFSNCTSLKNLGPLSKWDVSSARYMSGMFFSCTSLKALRPLSKWDVSSARYMRSMFSSCTSLKTLKALSRWDTRSLRDVGNMFAKCRSLSDVTALAKWRLPKFRRATDMFRGAYKIRKVAVSSSSRKWVGKVPHAYPRKGEEARFKRAGKRRGKLYWVSDLKYAPKGTYVRASSKRK